jgi:hypothetical protein
MSGFSAATAGPSNALRYCRDDKGRAVTLRKDSDSDGQDERLLRSNCGSLDFAPPDFLLRPVALINCVRLSLRRAANVVVVSSAK